MSRNPLFRADNFLIPEFPVAWPFNDVESDYLKGWVALAAALVLILFARKAWVRRVRLQRATFTVMVLISGLCYTNFLTLHGPRGKGYRFVHAHDFFHYAMGSKYFPELGYDFLYEASLLALDEGSGAPDFLEDKYYREKRTDRLLRASTLRGQSVRIRALFSDERWDAFKRDTEFFRQLRGEKYYLQMYADHGYNPSPPYTAFSRLFTAHVAFSPRSLVGLFLLDPLLLLATFAMLAWAFGARGALLVALLFFLGHPGRFAWVGGSLLRMPWLAALGCGVALAQKGRPLAAGVLLGVSAGFRGFPGLVLVGLAGPFLWNWIEGRYDRGRARGAIGLVLSAAATLVLLALASTFALGRPGVLGEWLVQSRAHGERFALNSIGIRPALAFDPGVTRSSVKREYVQNVLEPGQYGLPNAETPGLTEYYDQRKQETLRGRRWAYGFLLVAAWALFALATRRASVAQTLVLGLALIFFSGLNVSSYYWVFLALLPLHALAAGESGRGVAHGLTSAMLLLVAFEYWIAQAFADMDVVFALESILFGALLLGLLGREAARAVRCDVGASETTVP